MIGFQQLIATATSNIIRIDALQALLNAGNDVGSRLIWIDEIQKVADARKTVWRQFVGVRVAVGCPENVYPLIKIERQPVEALDLTTREAATVRHFRSSEISPELRYGSFLRETPERRVEAAKDAISADAGAEGVLGAF